MSGLPNLKNPAPSSAAPPVPVVDSPVMVSELLTFPGVNPSPPLWWMIIPRPQNFAAPDGTLNNRIEIIGVAPPDISGGGAFFGLFSTLAPDANDTLTPDPVTGTWITAAVFTAIGGNQYIVSITQTGLPVPAAQPTLVRGVWKGIDLLLFVIPIVV